MLVSSQAREPLVYATLSSAVSAHDKFPQVLLTYSVTERLEGRGAGPQCTSSVACWEWKKAHILALDVHLLES